MVTSLSVLIFRGSPVDASKYRHTALFLEFPDKTTWLLHVTGASGFFRIEAKLGEDLSKSTSFAQIILIGNIQGEGKTAILSAITSTPVKNSDSSWNCQHWIGDALKELSDRGWITSDTRSQAINAMADVIIEAPDEP